MNQDRKPLGHILNVVFFIFLTNILVPVFAVNHQDFKTCAQSGFCKRNRGIADNAAALGDSWTSPYELEVDTLTLEGGILNAVIRKPNSNGEEIILPLVITLYESGASRIVIDEEKRMQELIELRHGSKANKRRYDEAGKWAIVGELPLSESATLKKENADGSTYLIEYGGSGRFTAILRPSPFEVEFQIDGSTHIHVNSRALMNVEHWRPKSDEASDGDESTWWEETFQKFTDSKPRGPESVAMDITFPGYSHVFGIPEHADQISLRETRGGPGNHEDPYRLYNSDVFEYELNSPMSLYGAIPFMQAHRVGSTVGVFWLNAAETWIDIVKKHERDQRETSTHWISEAGRIDFFVFLGDTPNDINKNYGELTGFPQLPQQFAIGYHQCRWNYISDEDVKTVDATLDKYQIPYDAIWLDIEYTDERKYFTWDPWTFPDPKGMQEQLMETERKLVVLIDPHIKKESGYFVSDEMRSQGLAILNKDHEIYDGSCWPGMSNWIDAFNPDAAAWWNTLHKYDRFHGSCANLYIENDMNEPSVFHGPELTMPRDNIHHGDWEHRDVHNVNGLTVVNATFQAFLDREPNTRPFLLTRSFYSGSQRLTAMWTGDNQAKWEHLAISIPMILNNGIAGFPFAGADVGGFFDDPKVHLLTRWYQAGIWYPFFRAHSHLDTKRREPYLIAEPFRSMIIRALRLRYQLLPAWYTAFHEASVNGMPIIRPQFYVFPEDEAGFAVDDQLWLGGTGILVKPVVADADSTEVYLAGEEKYYDYFDFTIYQPTGKQTVEAPIEKIPIFIQGGHIIPRRDRPRRSSALMRWDPFTLIITLTKEGTAEGSLYFDDGETFDYREGAYVHRRFVFQHSVLSASDIGARGVDTDGFLKKIENVTAERIVLIDPPEEWKKKTTVQVLDKVSGLKHDASMMYYEADEDDKADYVVVKKPNMGIGSLWQIKF